MFRLLGCLPGKARAQPAFPLVQISSGLGTFWGHLEVSFHCLQNLLEREDSFFGTVTTPKLRGLTLQQWTSVRARALLHLPLLRSDPGEPWVSPADLGSAVGISSGQRHQKWKQRGQQEVAGTVFKELFLRQWQSRELGIERTAHTLSQSQRQAFQAFPDVIPPIFPIVPPPAQKCYSLS